MKNVLYIGNYLHNEQHNPTYMEALGSFLGQQGYSIRYSSNIKNKLPRLLDMLQAITKNRSWADIVLIDTYSTLNFYYALGCSQLCRTLGLPYICILHGGNLPKRLERNKSLSKLIFKNSKANVAPSKYLYNSFLKFYDDNTVHIPNAIEINDYEFFDRDFKEPKLLWVRSFAKIYNPNMALRVLSQLKNRGYNASLCMVGPDSDGSLVEAKDLAMKMDLDVMFTGKLKKREWREISKNYNIFINTTNFDNTPLSVIEAMALGLPVVSTNVGGMPYLIENNLNGILVDPSDVIGMVGAISKMMDDFKLREAIIQNARKKAESFDWEVVKHKWNRVLN